MGVGWGGTSPRPAHLSSRTQPFHSQVYPQQNRVHVSTKRWEVDIRFSLLKILFI